MAASLMRSYELFLLLKYASLVIGGLAGIGWLCTRPRGRGW